MSGSGIKERRRWWTREDVLLLILMGALFYLPGLGRIPLFDRDEPRFAVAARTMVRTGDYIVPHFNGALRPDKPPLAYWLMDATGWAAGWTGAGRAGWGGGGELGVRLPSAICGTLTLIVVYLMVGTRFGRLTGLVAALMLGSCVLFTIMSRMATADATMVFFIAVAMACAWQAWDAGTSGQPGTGHLPRTDYLIDRTAEKADIVLDRIGPVGPRRMSWGLALLFWVALAGGILTKGVPLLFVLVPMLALSLATGQWPWWRQLRPLWGVPLMVALVGWWVAWAGVATDWKLIDDMIGTHFVARTTGMGSGSEGLRHYGQPPGFFLATVWGTFWPWSVLLVPAAYHTVRRLRGRTVIALDKRPYQFLAAWVVPMWILLELSRGKLFHYPLPTFLGLAILCADTLVQSWNRMTDVLAAPWVAALRWVILGVWTALGAGVLWVGYNYVDGEQFWIYLPFGGALVATGVAAALAWGRPSWPFVTVLAWGGALLCASSVLLPELLPLEVSKLVGQKMAEIVHGEPDFGMAAAGYTEGSLVFYAGRDVALYGSAEDMLAAVPFAAEGAPPPEQKMVVAVDDAGLALLRSRKLVYYEMPRYVGCDAAASFKAVAVTVVTNVPVRPAGTASATGAASATRAPDGPEKR